jgi:hypothetical protein
MNLSFLLQGYSSNGVRDIRVWWYWVTISKLDGLLRRFIEISFDMNTKIGILELNSSLATISRRPIEYSLASTLLQRSSLVV